MRLYQLFSEHYFLEHHRSFDERWQFFQLVLEHQMESTLQLFSKELAETCPCCGYPVFDTDGRRAHHCLICGWAFFAETRSAGGKIELHTARRAFEREMIAQPLTDIQPWLGWDTPVDLRLNQIVAAGFDKMVGEKNMDLINHLLEFCHQLLSYKAFRREVGIQLWEGHKDSLLANEIDQYEFKEEEVEKTFYHYIHADNWTYLKHFLHPFHCVGIDTEDMEVIATSSVEDLDQLMMEDRRYFAYNLEPQDPLYFVTDGDNQIYLHDFAGKELGRLPEKTAHLMSAQWENGTSFFILADKCRYDNGVLAVDVVISGIPEGDDLTD
jgi:hypothetical protein